MKTLYNLNIVFLSALMLVACTDKKELTPDTHSNGEIDFSCSISGSAQTKADPAILNFDAGTTMGVFAYGDWTKTSGGTPTAIAYEANSSTAAVILKRNATTATKFDYTQNTLYWDNFGTADVNNTAGRAKGIEIYAVATNGKSYLAVGPFATAGGYKPAFDGTLESDQKTNGIANYDVLTSNTYKTGNTYKFDSKGTGANLLFTHALSKITVNLKMGDGYTAAELTTNLNAAVTVKNMYADYAFNVKNTPAITCKNTSQKDFKAELSSKKTAADVTAKGDLCATFSCLVVPGNKMVKDQNLLVLTVNGNTYNVNPNKMIALLDGGTSTSEQAFVAGNNYIFNIVVSKEAIAITATLKDWTDNGAVENDGVISFTADSKNQGGTNGNAFTKAFTVYSTTATAGTGYTKGSLFTYGTAYTTTTPMYWQSNTDKRFFRAAIYDDATTTVNKDATVASDKVSGIAAVPYVNSADLLWGTSGATIYEPTVKAVKMQFSHALSYISVEVATSTDASKIDLTSVSKVEIVGTKIASGELSLHAGTVSIASTVAAANLALNAATTGNSATKYACVPYLVIPQALTSDAKIKITLTDNTTFSVPLETIHKAAAASGGFAQTSAEWKQGEKYSYKITIKKSGTAFTATVKDWVIKNGSGNANMDW